MSGCGGTVNIINNCQFHFSFFLHHFSSCTLPICICMPGGAPKQNREGMCGQLPKTLTLFVTKICDISDPTLFMT